MRNSWKMARNLHNNQASQEKKKTLNKRNTEGREEGMSVIWKAKNKGMEGQEIEKAKKLKITINEERDRGGEYKLSSKRKDK